MRRANFVVRRMRHTVTAKRVREDKREKRSLPLNSSLRGFGNVRRIDVEEFFLKRMFNKATLARVTRIITRHQKLFFLAQNST